MNETLINKTKEKAKEIFANELSGHDFWYTLRVYIAEHRHHYMEKFLEEWNEEK